MARDRNQLHPYADKTYCYVVIYVDNETCQHILWSEPVNGGPSQFSKSSAERYAKWLLNEGRNEYDVMAVYVAKVESSANIARGGK